MHINRLNRNIIHDVSLHFNYSFLLISLLLECEFCYVFDELESIYSIDFGIEYLIVWLSCFPYAFGNVRWVCGFIFGFGRRIGGRWLRVFWLEMLDIVRLLCWIFIGCSFIGHVNDGVEYPRFFKILEKIHVLNFKDLLYITVNK